MKEGNKKYGEATLALHRDIKSAVEKLVVGGGVPCVRVSAVEKEVRKDPRTVRFHLKLLEAAEYGKLSKDGSMFCPRKSEEK